MSLTFTFDVNPNSSLTQTLGSSSTKWLLNGHIPELVEVAVQSSNNTTATYLNSNITPNHIVLAQCMKVPADFDYVTSDGSITITCASGIPSMILHLGVKA